MFTLACSPYSPGVHQPAHAHDDLQITIVLRGSLEERVGATVERATALSVVVKDPGVVHDDRFGTAGALTARLVLGRTALADLVEHPSRARAWRWLHGVVLVRPFLRIVRCGVDGHREYPVDHDDILDILTGDQLANGGIVGNRQDQAGLAGLAHGFPQTCGLIRRSIQWMGEKKPTSLL